MFAGTFVEAGNQGKRSQCGLGLDGIKRSLQLRTTPPFLFRPPPITPNSQPPRSKYKDKY